MAENLYRKPRLAPGGGSHSGVATNLDDLVSRNALAALRRDPPPKLPKVLQAAGCSLFSVVRALCVGACSLGPARQVCELCKHCREGGTAYCLRTAPVHLSRGPCGKALGLVSHHGVMSCTQCTHIVTSRTSLWVLFSWRATAARCEDHAVHRLHPKDNAELCLSC